MAKPSINVEESILVVPEDGILGSSVLIPMGININKPNNETRLREVFNQFNDAYTDMMDFLTQIVPLAHQHFSKSDNLLLPKTPSKKRLATTWQQRVENNENVDPNINRVEEVPLLRRSNRISQQINTSSKADNPIKQRKTRAQKKKSSSSLLEQAKLASTAKVILKDCQLPSNKLKRTLPTSPLANKPAKKKSKSSDESSVDEEDVNSNDLPPSKIINHISTRAPENPDSTIVSGNGVQLDDTNNVKSVADDQFSHGSSVEKKPEIKKLHEIENKEHCKVPHNSPNILPNSCISTEPNNATDAVSPASETASKKIGQPDLSDTNKTPNELAQKIIAPDTHSVVSVNEVNALATKTSHQQATAMTNKDSEVKSSEPQISLPSSNENDICNDIRQSQRLSNPQRNEIGVKNGIRRSLRLFKQDCVKSKPVSKEATDSVLLVKNQDDPMIEREIISQKPESKPTVVNQEKQFTKADPPATALSCVNAHAKFLAPSDPHATPLGPSNVPATYLGLSDPLAQSLGPSDPHPTSLSLSDPPATSQGPSDSHPTSLCLSDPPATTLGPSDPHAASLSTSELSHHFSRALNTPESSHSRLKDLNSRVLDQEAANSVSGANDIANMDRKPTNSDVHVANINSENVDAHLQKNVVQTTPKRQPTRRSARLSRRVSKVSSGFVRRTSRRSSRKFSHYKKPISLKRVEVPMENIGIENDGNVNDCAEVTSQEHSSSSNSEDDFPKLSSTTINTPKNSYNVSTVCVSIDHIKERKDGKVADIVQKLNGNNLHKEQPNVFKTPNVIHSVRRIGSTIQGSAHKPSNLIGNVKTMIKRPSVKKQDANELVRQKLLELQRKEAKEKARKDEMEMNKRLYAEKIKRKREEKQKRVAEAKATRDREELDKKQRLIEEKHQMFQASEQARKKREDDETKKRLREQRTKEAEARRCKDNMERAKKLKEKEEEEKMYRDMLKRRQEQEEQERRQKIEEERRLHEQKQRERAREKEEERQRRIKEIKEREAKRCEKEDVPKKVKDEKDKEQDEMEKRLIQTVKEKLEEERRLKQDKLQMEERERQEQEEQRKREVQRMAALRAQQDVQSYLMTPPPAQTRRPATDENYDISDLRSDESTDDEGAPRKKVPSWAQGITLKSALLHQEEPRKVFEALISGFVPHAPDLDKIFVKKRKRFYQRTSSAHWGTPPLRSTCS